MGKAFPPGPGPLVSDPFELAYQPIERRILFEGPLPEHIVCLVSRGADGQTGLEGRAVVGYRVRPGYSERLDRIDDVLLLGVCQDAPTRRIGGVGAAVDDEGTGFVDMDLEGVVFLANDFVADRCHGPSSGVGGSRGCHRQV